MWCHDISHDITPHLTSFLSSKGPDVCRTGGVSDAGMIIWDSTDSSISATLVGIMAVRFDMSSTIAEDTLDELGTSLHWVSHTCTPSTGGILIIRTILPTIGEVGNACIKHSAGDVQ